MKFLWILIIGAVIIGLIKISFRRENAALATVPAGQVYEETQRQIYELLFCDELDGYEAIKEDIPVLFEPNPSREELLALANDPKAESRIRILAHRRLKELGIPVQRPEVFAVIEEFNQPGLGLDTLAVYADGSIRYINFSGKMLFIDDSLQETQRFIKPIFEQAQQLAAQAGGQRQDSRLPPPGKGQLRLTLLVNGEIYVRQASSKIMFNGPLGFPLLTNMALLLEKITSIALAEQEKQTADATQTKE